MKLYGYCHQCLRVKQVNVSGHGLAMMQARGSQVPTGVCDDCLEPRKKPVTPA